MPADPLTIGAVAVWIRKTAESFGEMRDTVFPPESVVYVSAKKYTGFGIVPFRQPDECWIGYLAVRLSNGNTWWYPIEDCQPYEKQEDWSHWIRLEKGLEGSDEALTGSQSGDPCPRR